MLKPQVSIRYCPRCGWLLRAAWLAQELLTTFADDLARVSLEPAESGVFQISCGEIELWERKKDGGFPEAKVLKQRLRDVIAPERHLGHSEPKR